VAVGGGGAHNLFLMKILRDYFNEAEVKKVKDYQLNEDFKEAIGFAVLANETLNGKPSNVPQVTGAVKPAVLGKICPV
jgi:anhydro-N-acetylmuramic acid kinase